jgi:hypothetical protein
MNLDDEQRKEDVWTRGARRLLLVVFLFFFLFLDQIAFIAVFRFFFLFFFVIIVVAIVRDDVQVNGMDLGHFQFGFALWAAQNFALLYFVFVDVDFGGTLGAANHGSILRKVGDEVPRPEARAPASSVLYTAA